MPASRESSPTKGSWDTAIGFTPLKWAGGLNRDPIEESGGINLYGFVEWAQRVCPSISSGSYQPPAGAAPAFPAIVLPDVTRVYDQNGRMSRVSSAGNVTDISYEQTMDSSTRTLLRHRMTHPELDLTTIEISTLAQGMTSISHETLESPAVFKQTRSLGSMGTSGGQPQAAIIQVDPHFDIGAQAAASRWLYTYDTRGQVTSARRQYATDPGGTSFADLSPLNQDYSFNDIGGRAEDNALNQIINRTSPGKLVTGLAPVSQAVSVNGGTATRYGAWYTHLLPSAGGGSPSPQWSQVDVHAEDSSATAETVHGGKVYMPPASFTHAYDADGNTLQADGRWNLLWDAENRLTQAVTTTAAITAGVPDLRLTFGYDAQGRRVSKKVEKRAGATSSWEVLSDIRFIYEGWNLVAEVELRLTAYDAPAPGGRPHLLRSYTWGPDLSGSLTGAGGVGGLLCLTRHERGVSPADSYWATSDLNGNVIGLSAVSTVRHALYEYNAFGSPVRVNEPEPELNPMRFSSKYTDVETNWLYYGYRYYSPETGRWLNRDPIEEEGGLNLYGMVGNDPVNFLDYLGQRTFKDFSPNYRSIVEQKVPTGYGATTYQPSESGLTAVMLSFYFRGTPGPFSSMRARTDDSMDISKTSALKDNFEKVDEEVVADFFGDKLSKAVKEMRKANSGHIGLHIADSPSGMVSTLLTQAALQHVTVSFEMSCDLENSCGGICRANLALYDLYDFKANGNLDKPLDWILHQGLGPGGLKAGTPYHVFGVWQRKYTFDEFFKITKAENIR
ncbi:MAG: hypothetical protein CJBNEKGG_04437 [Prosthecobacter sp.]|nr:hypothetical protein [Prosthecobacter sp.]